ncbi:hypothetical protein BB560_004312 [Smittium megazygosporum]|uniref:COPII coat assembly protein SEC16 n=1 Tax=Smittium megazygosporum TaxID=133381 RepID=A0A2T9Z9K1_9FUNG|nr:hypothetical protein BB560_004312 [Smittium megazygosporum]
MYNQQPPNLQKDKKNQGTLQEGIPFLQSGIPSSDFFSSASLGGPNSYNTSGFAPPAQNQPSTRHAPSSAYPGQNFQTNTTPAGSSNNYPYSSNQSQQYGAYNNQIYSNPNTDQNIPFSASNQYDQYNANNTKSASNSMYQNISYGVSQQPGSSDQYTQSYQTQDPNSQAEDYLQMLIDSGSLYFDQSSSSYYDVNTGHYFDPNYLQYFNPDTNDWYYYDETGNVIVSTDYSQQEDGLLSNPTALSQSVQQNLQTTAENFFDNYNSFTQNPRGSFSLETQSSNFASSQISATFGTHSQTLASGNIDVSNMQSQNNLFSSSFSNQPSSAPKVPANETSLGSTSLRQRSRLSNNSSTHFEPIPFLDPSDDISKLKAVLSPKSLQKTENDFVKVSGSPLASTKNTLDLPTKPIDSTKKEVLRSPKQPRDELTSSVTDPSKGILSPVSAEHPQLDTPSDQVSGKDQSAQQEIGDSADSLNIQSLKETVSEDKSLNEQAISSPSPLISQDHSERTDHQVTKTTGELGSNEYEKNHHKFENTEIPSKLDNSSSSFEIVDESSNGDFNEINLISPSRNILDSFSEADSLQKINQAVISLSSTSSPPKHNLNDQTHIDGSRKIFDTADFDASVRGSSNIIDDSNFLQYVPQQDALVSDTVASGENEAFSQVEYVPVTEDSEVPFEYPQQYELPTNEIVHDQDQLENSNQNMNEQPLNPSHGQIYTEISTNLSRVETDNLVDEKSNVNSSLESGNEQHNFDEQKGALEYGTTEAYTEVENSADITGLVTTEIEESTAPDNSNIVPSEEHPQQYEHYDFDSNFNSANFVQNSVNAFEEKNEQHLDDISLIDNSSNIQYSFENTQDSNISYLSNEDYGQIHAESTSAEYSQIDYFSQSQMSNVDNLPSNQAFEQGVPKDQNIDQSYVFERTISDNNTGYYINTTDNLGQNQMQFEDGSVGYTYDSTTNTNLQTQPLSDQQVLSQPVDLNITDSGTSDPYVLDGGYEYENVEYNNYSYEDVTYSQYSESFQPNFQPQDLGYEPSNQKQLFPSFAPIISFGFSGKVVTIINNPYQGNNGIESNVKISSISDLIPHNHSASPDADHFVFDGNLDKDSLLKTIEITSNKCETEIKGVDIMSSWRSQSTLHLSNLAGSGSGGSSSKPSTGPSLELSLQKKIMWAALGLVLKTKGFMEQGTSPLQSLLAESLKSLGKNTVSCDGVDNDGTSNPNLTENDAQMTSPIVPGTNSENNFIENLEAFLLKGDRQGAVEFAISHKSWAHALIISSCVNIKVWQSTISRYSQFLIENSKGLESNSIFKNQILALSVQYGLFSGLQSESLDILSNTSDEGLVNGDKKESWSDKWAETLALIVANYAPGYSKTITALGQKLSEENNIFAAQVCFVLSMSSPLLFKGQNAAPTQYPLLGTMNYTPSVNGQASHDNISSLGMSWCQSSELSLIWTEMYEVAQLINQLKNSSSKPGNAPRSKTPGKSELNKPSTNHGDSKKFYCIPHLQAYKLSYAWWLVDCGYDELALKYCDSIANILSGSQNFNVAYLHPVFIRELIELQSRLIGSGVTRKTNSEIKVSKTTSEGFGWLNISVKKPTLTGIMSVFDSSIDKLITGSNSQATSEVQSDAEGYPSGPNANLNQKPKAHKINNVDNSFELGPDRYSIPADNLPKKKNELTHFTHDNYRRSYDLSRPQHFDNGFHAESSPVPGDSSYLNSVPSGSSLNTYSTDIYAARSESNYDENEIYQSRSSSQMNSPLYSYTDSVHGSNPSLAQPQFSSGDPRASFVPNEGSYSTKKSAYAQKRHQKSSHYKAISLLNQPSDGASEGTGKGSSQVGTLNHLLPSVDMLGSESTLQTAQPEQGGSQNINSTSGGNDESSNNKDDGLDDDFLGFGNKSLSKNKIKLDSLAANNTNDTNEKNDSKSTDDKEGDDDKDPSKSQPAFGLNILKGWGWWGGNKGKISRGDLGEKSDFYYDPVAKRWVSKSTEDENSNSPARSTPPPMSKPPSRLSSIGKVGSNSGNNGGNRFNESGFDDKSEFNTEFQEERTESVNGSTREINGLPPSNPQDNRPQLLPHPQSLSNEISSNSLRPGSSLSINSNFGNGPMSSNPSLGNKKKAFPKRGARKKYVDVFNENPN